MTKAWLAGALLLWATRLMAADLMVLVDASTEMPWAQLQEDRIVAGIHHDLGKALALRLGRKPRFLVLPRKRIAQALESGVGDLVCATTPAWQPGPFDWSRPFLPHVELLVSLRSARRLNSVAELAGVPIGTVNGFAYPELERALGQDFVRDDAPNASANLRKLALGRIQHATISRSFLDYQLQQGLLNVQLAPHLVLRSFLTQCAVSRRASVSVAEVDQAIAAQAADGEWTRLMTRYSLN